MSKWTIGILGMALFIICGDQFEADKNMIIIIMVAFLLILVSTETKKS